MSRRSRSRRQVGSPSLAPEAMESRQLMTAVAYRDGNTLKVLGTPNADVVTIEQKVHNGVTQIRVHAKDLSTSATKTTYFSPSWVAEIDFAGEGGNDSLDVKLDLHVLAHGGAGDDKIKTGGGGDYLFGDDGNDQLYGNGSTDLLFGGEGGDFLDGGAGSNYLQGDGGTDFHADVWAVNGATDDDVNQGMAPNCWALAAIMAAADSGIDLASRISYEGNGIYKVKMYNDNGVGFKSHFVSFNGGLVTGDPDVMTEYESWVILTERALMQEVGIDWTNPDEFRGGSPAEVIHNLTGRAAVKRTPEMFSELWFDSAGQPRLTQRLSSITALEILDALVANKAVTMYTHPKLPSGSILVEWHAYSVKNVWWDAARRDYLIVVRNPWHSDGGSGADGINDGLVTLTGREFANQVAAYHIS